MSLLSQSQVRSGSFSPFSRNFNCGLAILIAVCVHMHGCSRPEQPIPEEPPASQVATPNDEQRNQTANVAPPKLTEVHAVINRVFKEAAFLDGSRNPNFIDGDFNGDLSQDIAVVLKPSMAKLAEMNEDYPAWMLKDPFSPSHPGSLKLRVEANEVLLAVIHGYGEEGWRDPQATQTYLLKNAAGSGMKTHPGRQFVAANRGKNLPRLHGDLIGQNLRDRSGYLYYSGATYSWYDPKTFKGEPERHLAHQPRVARAK